MIRDIRAAFFPLLGLVGLLAAPACAQPQPGSPTTHPGPPPTVAADRAKVLQEALDAFRAERRFPGGTLADGDR